MNLAGDLGMEESVPLSEVLNDQLGLSVKRRDLLGRDPTLQDPDYQTPTPH